MERCLKRTDGLSETQSGRTGEEMQMRSRLSMVFILALCPWLALSVGCSNVSDGGSDGNSLAGTSWRLVKILSMNDQTYTPNDRSKYTLAFEAGGRISVRADCNSGQGSWSEPVPGQLTFGRLVTTRVMCPPESLHDRFIRDLGAVRSYRIQDGRLYLSLMADGGVYEFEPAPR